MTDVTDRLESILPMIAEQAPRTDDAGRVPPRIIRALRDAGVFRMLQPERWGGAEARPSEFFDIVRTIAAECASTGWLVSVMGVHPWHVALFDEQAQQEVWEHGTDILISSAYAPIGSLHVDGDGFRLKGHWRFSSGCEHAEWVLLGATNTDDGTMSSVLVPMSEVTVKHVWDSMGLRGTASDDILIDDLHVPAHRVLDNAAMVKLDPPGREVNVGPLYGVPFGAMFTASVTAPVQGAATGCYNHFVDVMRDRERGSLGGGALVDDPFAQVAVARAACEIDAGILQLDRDLDELMQVVETDGRPDMRLRMRTRRDQVRATERSIEAVDTLFRLAGGTSLGRGNPIERGWRDAHAAASHVANEADRTMAQFGRAVFGLPIEERLV